MARILGRDDLLSGDILKRELFQIPNTDLSVWMRELTAEHLLEFKSLISKYKSEGVKKTTLEEDLEIMKVAISYSACDESGNLLFSSPEEAAGLSKNNFNVLMDLGNKALELSGIKIANGGQVKREVADNPPNAPTPSSPGNLPSNSKRRRRK